MANVYVQFSFTVTIRDTTCRAWALDELERLDDSEDGAGFDWLLETDRVSLWIYASESGDIDRVEAFLRDLVAHGFEDAIGFTWSMTCDRMRVGEFGGGALVVNRNNEGEVVVEHFDAFAWLEDKL